MSVTPRARKSVDELLDELLGRAGAGGDAERADAVEPRLVELAGVVDQMRARAVVARHLDQPLRVRRVARADHEHELALVASSRTAAWRLVVA